MKQFVILAGALLLSGCFGGDHQDLRDWIAEVKSRKAAPIDPIPEMKAPEVYSYRSGKEGLRTPFIFGEEREPEHRWIHEILPDAAIRGATATSAGFPRPAPTPRILGLSNPIFYRQARPRAGCR